MLRGEKRSVNELVIWETRRRRCLPDNCGLKLIDVHTISEALSWIQTFSFLSVLIDGGVTVGSNRTTSRTTTAALYEEGKSLCWWMPFICHSNSFRTFEMFVSDVKYDKPTFYLSVFSITLLFWANAILKWSLWNNEVIFSAPLPFLLSFSHLPLILSHTSSPISFSRYFFSSSYSSAVKPTYLQ